MLLRLQDTINELLGNDKSSRMVFWQEVFQFNNPHPNTVAHLWNYNDADRPKAIARKNYAILKNQHFF